MVVFSLQLTLGKVIFLENFFQTFASYRFMDYCRYARLARYLVDGCMCVCSHGNNRTFLLGLCTTHCASLFETFKPEVLIRFYHPTNLITIHLGHRNVGKN